MSSTVQLLKPLQNLQALTLLTLCLPPHPIPWLMLFLSAKTSPSIHEPDVSWCPNTRQAPGSVLRLQRWWSQSSKSSQSQEEKDSTLVSVESNKCSGNRSGTEPAREWGGDITSTEARARHRQVEKKERGIQVRENYVQNSGGEGLRACRKDRALSIWWLQRIWCQWGSRTQQRYTGRLTPKAGKLRMPAQNITFQAEANGGMLVILSVLIWLLLLFLFSRWVVSSLCDPMDSIPCLSLSPRVCSSSCPLNWWCHPTISSSVAPFSSWLQSFPASGSFPMSQLFTSGGQRLGVSASASVLPVNIQGWFSLGWTDLISLLSKGLSRVFSRTTVQKHKFFSFFMV